MRLKGSVTFAFACLMGITASQGVEAGEGSGLVECTRDGPAAPWNWVQPDPQNGGVWVFEPNQPQNTVTGFWSGTYHFLGICELLKRIQDCLEQLVGPPPVDVGPLLQLVDLKPGAPAEAGGGPNPLPENPVADYVEGVDPAVFVVVCGQ